MAAQGRKGITLLHYLIPPFGDQPYHLGTSYFRVTAYPYLSYRCILPLGPS